MFVAGAAECSPIFVETIGLDAALCLIPAGSGRAGSPVLYMPGDRGTRGFAADTVERLSELGHDVYILETPTFLAGLPTEATAGTVSRRLSEISGGVRALAGDRPILVGWSAGAGLALLAATRRESEVTFRSLVLIALAPRSPLSWSLRRVVLESLFSVEPRNAFDAAPLISLVSPTPLALIVSDNDEHVSLAQTEAMFAAAGESKRLFFIAGRSHRFSGARDEFFKALETALAWQSDALSAATPGK